MSTAARNALDHDAALIHLRGTVVVRAVNAASKSAQRVAFLDTGNRFIGLKRPAARPFHDPVLLRLEGSTIRCSGRIEDGRLVLSAWRRILT